MISNFPRFFVLFFFYFFALLRYLSLLFSISTMNVFIFFFRRPATNRFPPTIPFSIPNLLAFIMARCHFGMRWQLALSSCSNVCILKNIIRLRRLTPFLRNDITSLRLFLPTVLSRSSRRIIANMITRLCCLTVVVVLHFHYVIHVFNKYVSDF